MTNQQQLRTKLLNIASTLSVAFCAAAMLLWISSYFASCSYERTVSRQTAAELCPFMFNLRTARGILTFVTWRYTVPLQNLSPTDEQNVSKLRGALASQPSHWISYGPSDFKPTEPTFLGQEGFEFHRGQSSHGWYRISGILASLPCWFLVAVFSALPVMRVSCLIRLMTRSTRAGAPPPFLFGAAVGTPRGRPSRIFSTVAIAFVIAFVTIQVIMRLTQTFGWSARYTTANSTLVEWAAQRNYFTLTLIQNWPRPEAFNRLRAPPEWRPLYPYRDFGKNFRDKGMLGFTRLAGSVSFGLDRDGAVSLLPFGKDSYYMGQTAMLPYRQFQVSLRGLSVLSAIVPLLWLMMSLRARIRRQIVANRGLCPVCDYDLTANSSGVCPECGSRVQSADDPSISPSASTNLGPSAVQTANRTADLPTFS